MYLTLFFFVCSHSFLPVFFYSFIYLFIERHIFLFLLSTSFIIFFLSHFTFLSYLLFSTSMQMHLSCSTTTRVRRGRWKKWWRVLLRQALKQVWKWFLSVYFLFYYIIFDHWSLIGFLKFLFLIMFVIITPLVIMITMNTVKIILPLFHIFVCSYKWISKLLKYNFRHDKIYICGELNSAIY